ncbi:HAD-IIIC family phosphatase [Hallella colorans]|uniref:HAD superfamily phosphatase (TIGR01681 family)/FkbH-like protein n=2 Tax=Hallella colorans TaxID=1703337 RepID=A0A2U0UNV1_9BACT|nr:HAD-IIIC family phosphatase [Hallella colorans]PVX59280.1 HAD superfamily phosphatase (TIGR01681 family)/FkbH-like protein [Hallella colorans]
MFEFIYSKDRIKGLNKVITQQYSKQKLIPLLWTEHCVECAAPACYDTCSRYKKREDGNCIRIENGISPIILDGKLGAKVEFRTWAKIESQLKTKALERNKYAETYKVITKLGAVFRKCAALSPIQKIHTFFDHGWFSFRQRYINYLIRSNPENDTLELHLVIENQDHETSFLIDVKSTSKLLFRERIEIPLGKSEFQIAIPPYSDSKDLYFINIHPTNAEEHVSIIFSYLELEPRSNTKGKKIKCVVWDLDNTLWKGVMIENEQVEVRNEFIQLIKFLDSKGIVNSIASKNDEPQVMAFLRKHDIDKYFVFNKINWNPKSVNINHTLTQMNIHPNTVVFVDDNPFERNEVKLALPSITCIDPKEILSFSKCNRFNIVVTEDSKKRRETYRMLEKQKREEEVWDGDINDFLASCKIRLILSSPTFQTLPRCYELLQRTNQLNSSGRRLSLEEVTTLVESTDIDSYVLQSTDKFGDYGIVGFLIISRADNIPCVTDFVISCRVANKKIEPTLINYLAAKYGGKIHFNFKRTIRNGPMFKIINELNMEKVQTASDHEIFNCVFDKEYSKIVTITDNTRK